jgi:hypothetical protein
VREILLDRLTDITNNQTLLDRILGCGDLMLESPGRDSPEVFPDLPHPVRIQNEIYRLINQRRPGAWVAATGDPAGVGALGAAGTGAVGAPPAPAAPPAQGATPPEVSSSPAPFAGVAATDAPAAPREPSVADQLTQLDDLRKRGVISRREFAAKKAELLSRM